MNDSIPVVGRGITAMVIEYDQLAKSNSELENERLDIDVEYTEGVKRLQEHWRMKTLDVATRLRVNTEKQAALVDAIEKLSINVKI